MVMGAGDCGRPKLDRQPFLFACPILGTLKVGASPRANGNKKTQFLPYPR